MQTMKAVITLIACTAACWSAAGCGTNAYSTGGPTSNVDLVRRVTRDPGLASDIQIDAARINAAGASKVAQLTVRNAGGGERRIQTQFTWFDVSGAKVSGGSDWSDYTLGPGDVREISSLGIPEATDFRVLIRSQK